MIKTNKTYFDNINIIRPVIVLNLNKIFSIYIYVLYRDNAHQEVSFDK